MLQRVRFESGSQRDGLAFAPSHPPERYREWLAHIFDQPVSKNGWFFEPGARHFVGDASEIIALIEYTLAHSGRDLARFSDAQVDHGLNYLLNSGCSDLVQTLRSDLQPAPARLRAIGALSALYRDCLYPRCAPVLGHACDSGGRPLNYLCYLLWEVAPLTDWEQSIGGEAFYACVLGVLTDALSLPHAACQESALTGLAKLHTALPDTVSSLIEQWLASDLEISSRLRRYALAAANGIVL